MSKKDIKDQLSILDADGVLKVSVVVKHGHGGQSTVVIRVVSVVIIVVQSGNHDEIDTLLAETSGKISGVSGDGR